MNKIVGRDILISYPSIRERFIIHADARKMNIGRLSSGKQEDHRLLCTQFNPCLINYTTTERKLLSIVETLNEKYLPFY